MEKVIRIDGVIGDEQNTVENLQLQLDIVNGRIHDEALVRLLRNDAERAGATEDFKQALRVDTNGKPYLNLDAFTNRKWMYNRILNIITKHTVDLVYPGNQLIQVTDYGMGNVRIGTDLDFTHFSANGGIINNTSAALSVGDSYWRTVTFDVASITGFPAGIQNIAAHWTMSCGNDVIEGCSPVPEPQTLLLMGIGLLGLAFVGRKKMGDRA